MSAVLTLANARTLLTESLLRQFDTPGPRHTSHPAADRFTPRFGPADAARALEANRASASAAPLSPYMHIPFCEQLRHHCACNKIITKHRERAAEYLDALETTLALVVASPGSGRPVSQLALYAHAHLPERFKPPRRTAETDLPRAEQRVSMLAKQRPRVSKGVRVPPQQAIDP